MFLELSPYLNNLIDLLDV